MADKITQNSTLNLNAVFYDGDTRAISLDNPKANITAAQIKALAATTKTTQAIIGDKGSAAFVGFDAAEVLNKKTTQFDLR